MTFRDEYVHKMEAAIDKLAIKVSLARLEMRDAREDFLRHCDRLRDNLTELRNCSASQWNDLRGAFEHAWETLRSAKVAQDQPTDESTEARQS